MRCPGLGRSPAQAFADGLGGGRLPSFPQATGRTTVFTQSGRAAITLAARIWGICSEDEVLIPAYHCGSEVSPLIATGARIVMYRVDAGAQIDLPDLLRRITARTRLIHVIHYFGRPTDLVELAAICRERNIRLLEDCALSLYSANTGCTGDGAIFSFYKTLPCCAGGALTLRAPPSEPPSLRPSRNLQAAREVASLVRKWATASLPTLRTTKSRSPDIANDCASRPDLPMSYYSARDVSLHRPSRFTFGSVARANVHHVVRTRRANFSWLQQLLADSRNVALLWRHPLEPDTCPLGFPILVRDKSRWCAALNAAGVPVSPWWSGFHRGLDWSDHIEAATLKAELILLPVHQNLDARHMDFIARTVRAIAASAEPWMPARGAATDVAAMEADQGAG